MSTHHKKLKKKLRNSEEKQSYKRTFESTKLFYAIHYSGSFVGGKSRKVNMIGI